MKHINYMKSESHTIMSTERIMWLDALRTLAIICVLTCHCLESVYRIDSSHMMASSYASRIFAVVGISFGRLGVPFFLLITGYLLLNRTYSTEKCMGFWKNKCVHLLVCAELWIIFYWLFINLHAGHELKLSVLLEEMLFLRESSANQLWYLPLIIGFYLLVPLAANALQTVDTKIIKILLMIYAAFAFGYPLVSTLFKIMGISHGLKLQFAMGFSGGAYGIYMISGFLMRKGWLAGIRSGILALFAAVSFAFTVVFQFWAFAEGVDYELWYSFAGLFVCAVCLFELASRMKKIRFYKHLLRISYYSFAVYLIHNFFRIILESWITGLGIARPLTVMILFILTFGLSLAAACVINRIPKIGKYILYTK